ncbi:MAG: ParA family protein [Bacteroidetes bacterium]|nr:ParA family protein [Bacteroidota bacterium]
MIKVIAFSNQKGGVGKTTSAVNIGAYLASQGKRVLLIDLDPQANMTKGLGIEEPEISIYGVLLGEQKIKAFPIRENLVLVPGSYGMSSFEKVKGDDLDKEFLLKEVIDPLKPKFDFILLDCPPALGLITINALAAADQVYIPLEAQIFGVDGLNKVLEIVEKVRKRINPKLEIGGVFFTRYNDRKILARDTADDLRELLKNKVLKTTIRENVALQEAPSLGKDVFTYAPDSHGARDYAKLTEEILQK